MMSLMMIVKYTYSQSYGKCIISITDTQNSSLNNINISFIINDSNIHKQVKTDIKGEAKSTAFQKIIIKFFLLRTTMNPN